MSLSDVLGWISHYESTDRPTAVNPTGAYRDAGLYQFITPTWEETVSQINTMGALRGWPGIDLAQYPTADTAPAAVQSEAAAWLYQQQGLQPWSTRGQVQAALDAGGAPPDTPDLSLVPSSVGGDYGGSTLVAGAPDAASAGTQAFSGTDVIPGEGFSGNFGQAGAFPTAPDPYTSGFAGMPGAADSGGFAGLGGGVVPASFLSEGLGGLLPKMPDIGGSVSTWWQNLLTQLTDALKRFGVIILGVVLIAAAAWAVTRESKG